MQNVKHGRNFKMGKFVIIEDDCEIGDNVTIEDFVVLKSGTVIGNNCHIYAGAKIGTPTFNLKVEKGKRLRTKQKGITILKDGVDIGHNTVIQRGVERNTIIGENTFINNLCNIGHDIIIGKDCTIGLSVSMSGFTEIGDKSYISPGVTILNRVKIGQNVTVGIGSLVLHDVSDNEKVVGRPAVLLDTYKKERRMIKEALNLELNAQPIATRKRKWLRRVKKITFLIKSALGINSQ